MGAGQDLTERRRMRLLTFGGEMIMIDAEWPEMPTRAPQLDSSSPVVIFVSLEDVDKAIERAVAGGAKVPATDQFWGDRVGWILDPVGHVRTVATRVEDTTEEESAERWAEIVAGSTEAE